MDSTRRVRLVEPEKVSILVSAESGSQRVFNTSDLWTVFSPHTESLREAFPAQHKPPPAEPPLPQTNSRSPEQRLVLVAFRLAVLEKIATSLGKWSFVWATVVLLGGYVSEIATKDFWIISALIITEGTRVLSRSTELEWQQTNYSLGVHNLSSFLLDKSSKFWRSSSAAHQTGNTNCGSPTPCKKQKSLYEGYGARRTWSLGTLPFIPYAGFISSKAISLVLYLLQLASAIVSIYLSATRLSEVATFREGNADKALALFYCLMLAEASLFLLERAYWEFKLRFQKILERAIRKCELEDEHLDTLKQYFYTIYSRCVNGSVFEGLELDLLDFALEKLQTSSREGQLGSVRILSTLVFKGVSREETRRRIGTTVGAVERLLEMITWKDLSDKDIRQGSTVVVSCLVRHRNIAFKLSAIPGSLEAVVSLLLGEGEEFDGERISGLVILNELAKDQRTCVRLGNTAGVISILVSFIRLHDLVNLQNQITWKIFKKSLQLLRLMVDVGGGPGHSLRNTIASMVFIVRNLQQIIEARAPKPDLQALALEILRSLATQDELRESVGATGGVIKCLMTILIRDTGERIDSLEFTNRMRAGEAISLLALQSRENCFRILRHRSYYTEQERRVSQNLRDLIDLLSKPLLGIHAATILRSLCGHLNQVERTEVSGAVDRIVQMVLWSDDKEQEAAIGLAAALVPLIAQERFEASFCGRLEQLVEAIVDLISDVPRASLNRTRRYSVELMNALMVKEARFLEGFRRHASVGILLEKMLENVSDVENFYTFSGVVGLTRHSVSLQQLIHLALSNLHSL